MPEGGALLDIDISNDGSVGGNPVGLKSV